MRVLDTAIGLGLLFLVLRVVVRCAQELRSQDNSCSSKAKALALTFLVVASYAWLIYFDAIVIIDRRTGAESDLFGFLTHPEDNSWLALPMHAWSCRHARIVTLSGLAPLCVGSVELFRSFRRAPTVARISAVVAAFLAKDDLCRPLFQDSLEREEARKLVERRIINIWMEHAGKKEVCEAIQEWSNKWKVILNPDRVQIEGTAYVG